MGLGCVNQFLHTQICLEGWVIPNNTTLYLGFTEGHSFYLGVLSLVSDWFPQRGHGLVKSTERQTIQKPRRNWCRLLKAPCEMMLALLGVRLASWEGTAALSFPFAELGILEISDVWKGKRGTWWENNLEKICLLHTYSLQTRNSALMWFP